MRRAGAAERGPRLGEMAQWDGTWDGTSDGEHGADQVMMQNVFELARDAGSAALARSIARERCHGLTADEVSKTELLVSEVVTNAIRYGVGKIRLRFADTAEGALRVEVHDEGADLPYLRVVGPESSGGRGLHIVDALSSAWGVQPGRGGKTVWFELLVEGRQNGQSPHRENDPHAVPTPEDASWSETAPLAGILDDIRQRMRTDTATILLMDRTRRVLEPTATSGLDRTVRGAPLVPIGQGFAGRVAQSRQPVILDHVSDSNVLNPVLINHGVRSLLGVPILVDSELLGVLHVGCLDHCDFGPSDVQQLSEIATELGRVLRRRFTDESHTAALTLQRGLLPSALVEFPGLEIAARYVPADGDLGGDWYDVFSLPDGSIAIAIGDVVGHGLDAAVVMGRLRSALRAYALDADDPAEVMRRLDRKICHFEPDTFATVLYGVALPPFERWRFSAAGHLPPILAGPQGSKRVDLPIDRPLGLAGAEPRRATEVVLPSEGTLCLFTDGLVERRPAPDEPDADIIGQNLQRLEDALVGVDDPEMACIRVLAGVVGDEIAEDDIALLIVRRREDHADV